MTPIRMAQYGTGHGHAEGKLAALRTCADIDLAGVYESDAIRGGCWIGRNGVPRCTMVR
jgi:hypothetical protein